MERKLLVSKQPQFSRSTVLYRIIWRDCLACGYGQLFLACRLDYHTHIGAVKFRLWRYFPKSYPCRYRFRNPVTDGFGLAAKVDAEQNFGAGSTAYFS